MKRFWQKQMVKTFISQTKVSIRHSIFVVPFFLLLSLAFSMSSCKEELSGLGADLLPGDDFHSMSFDSTTINLSQVTSSAPIKIQDLQTIYKRFATVDSIWFSTYSYNLLGEYKDAAFGSTSASLLFQLSPSGFIKNYTNQILPNAQFISLTLSLAKTDTTNYLILGSANATQKCQIYALKDTINTKPSDSSFYSNINLEPYIDRNRPIQVENEIYLSDNKDFKYRYKFKINDQPLIDKLMNIDTFQMKNKSLFYKTILKGFYISSIFPEGGSGGLLSAVTLASDSTFLELRYKNPNDTIIRSYKFYVSSFPMGLSNFKLEDRPVFDTAKYDYLQGLDSKCVKIDLEDLKKYRNSPISINKAELILSPDTIPDGLNYTNLPKKIYIFEKGVTNDVIIDDANPQMFSPDHFGGSYLNKSYHFNITRYVQNFVKPGNTKNPELLLKVYNSFYNGYFDAGRLAFKKKDGIKLKIYYTKIK